MVSQLLEIFIHSKHPNENSTTQVMVLDSDTIASLLKEKTYKPARKDVDKVIAVGTIDNHHVVFEFLIESRKVIYYDPCDEAIKVKSKIKSVCQPTDEEHHLYKYITYVWLSLQVMRLVPTKGPLPERPLLASTKASGDTMDDWHLVSAVLHFIDWEDHLIIQHDNHACGSIAVMHVLRLMGWQFDVRIPSDRKCRSVPSYLCTTLCDIHSATRKFVLECLPISDTTRDFIMGWKDIEEIPPQEGISEGEEEGSDDVMEEGNDGDKVEEVDDVTHAESDEVDGVNQDVGPVEEADPGEEDVGPGEEADPVEESDDDKSKKPEKMEKNKPSIPSLSIVNTPSTFIGNNIPPSVDAWKATTQPWLVLSPVTPSDDEDTTEHVHRMCSQLEPDGVRVFIIRSTSIRDSKSNLSLYIVWDISMLGGGMEGTFTKWVGNALTLTNPTQLLTLEKETTWVAGRERDDWEKWTRNYTTWLEGLPTNAMVVLVIDEFPLITHIRRREGKNAKDVHHYEVKLPNGGKEDVLLLSDEIVKQLITPATYDRVNKQTNKWSMIHQPDYGDAIGPNVVLNEFEEEDLSFCGKSSFFYEGPAKHVEEIKFLRFSYVGYLSRIFKSAVNHCEKKPSDVSVVMLPDQPYWLVRLKDRHREGKLESVRRVSLQWVRGRIIPSTIQRVVKQPGKWIDLVEMDVKSIFNKVVRNVGLNQAETTLRSREILDGEIA